MRRRVLAVLVVLVAVAWVGAAGVLAVQADQPAAVPQQLPLSDETAVAPAPAQTNAGLAAQTDGTHTYVRYREFLLQERLAAAENSTVQREILNDEVAELEAAIGDLREREESAYAAYADGDLSERELAWELGRTADEAAALERWLETYIDTVEETAGVEFVELGVTRNELRGLQIDVAVSQTPLRDRLYRSMTGDFNAVAGTDDFRFGTTNSQLTLTAIDGDAYVTETYRPDARGDAQLVTLNFAQVENRTDDLYPTFDGFNGIFAPLELGEAVWQLQLTEEYFDATLYYDEQTDAAFYERQEIDLQTVPTETVVNRTVDGLVITVEHTRPGGPAEVTVVDAESGDPVDATVAVDETNRGQTTAGSAWIIAPASQTTMTVVTDDTEIDVVVDWTQRVAAVG